MTIYDPRVKQLIKNKLYEYLYEDVEKKLKERLDQIIVQNCKELKDPNRSFSYKGKSYYHSSIHPALREPFPKNSLHSSMQNIMEDYIDEVERLNQEEIPYVLGYINKVMNSSDSLKDYLELFPNSVHQPIKDFIERCNCRNNQLTPKEIDEIKSDYVPVELMKKRMIINLLLKR